MRDGRRVHDPKSAGLRTTERRLPEEGPDKPPMILVDDQNGKHAEQYWRRVLRVGDPVCAWVFPGSWTGTGREPPHPATGHRRYTQSERQRWFTLGISFAEAGAPTSGGAAASSAAGAAAAGAAGSAASGSSSADVEPM